MTKEKRKTTKSRLFGLAAVVLPLLLCAVWGCKTDPVSTTGTLGGKVTDGSTGEPLQGVTVTLTPYNGSRTTGSDGYFEFQNVEFGNNPYTVLAEKKNYRSDSKEVNVQVGEFVPCDFQLLPSAPQLEVSQLSVDFGSEMTTYAIDVLNKGDAVLNWSVSEDVEWLSCLPTSGQVEEGQKKSVALNVDRTGLSRGNYSQVISFVSDKGGSANVTVKLSVQGTGVTVLPEELDFGTVTTTLQLTMSGGSNVSYTLTPSNSWIIPGKTSGTFSQTENIIVAVSRDGLAVGDYAGSLSLKVGDHSQTIPVRMSVAPKSLPIVSLQSVDGVSDVSAVFRGTVVSVGSSRIVRHGFCWGKSENPELSTAGETCNFGDCSSAKEMTYTTVKPLEPSTTYYVRAYAENSEGVSYSSQLKFSTTASPQKPEVETGSLTAITAGSARAGGNLLVVGIVSGVTNYGHVWNTKGMPTVSDLKSELGSQTSTGAFSSSLTGLKPNTLYYVRAYATNELGTSYGEEVTFTTTPDVITLTTSSPVSVTHNSATLGGRIADAGGNEISECGVCWGSGENPTTADNSRRCELADGSFSVRIETLAERTLYHVRAYAVAANGTAYYGNDVVFQTTHQIYLPQASGVTVSNVKVTAAALRASVTNDGDGTIADAGFVYSTTPAPSVADGKVSCGVQTGSYSAQLSNLAENTTYYVRAYVTNEAGTNYGEESSFCTLEIKQAELSSVTLKSFSHKSASFAATVEQLNNGTLTEVGFVYSTSPNPGLTNHKVACGTDASFSGSTSSLTASTTYYVRAYATNEKGTAFSEELTFTTKEEPEDSSFDVDDFGGDKNWD